MKKLKRILLVEDHLKDVELTLTALDEFHLANQVTVARDGAEALDVLNRRGDFKDEAGDLPVVVLLDIKLPKMNGLEVLEAMKSDARLRLMPVVMITSPLEEPDLAKACELGVNAYVVKPVDFNQFMEAVKQIGCFWAALNELPSIPPAVSPG
jgi:CheY-like chemotaxis protein